MHVPSHGQAPSQNLSDALQSHLSKSNNAMHRTQPYPKVPPTITIYIYIYIYIHMWLCFRSHFGSNVHKY